MDSNQSSNTGIPDDFWDELKALKIFLELSPSPRAEESSAPGFSTQSPLTVTRAVPETEETRIVGSDLEGQKSTIHDEEPDGWIHKNTEEPSELYYHFSPWFDHTDQSYQDGTSWDFVNASQNIDYNPEALMEEFQHMPPQNTDYNLEAWMEELQHIPDLPGPDGTCVLSQPEPSFSAFPLAVHEGNSNASVDMSKDKSPMDSRASVAVRLTNIMKNSDRSEAAQHGRRPGHRQRNGHFCEDEVRALVEGVEKLGLGRWADIKLEASDVLKRRSRGDLKVRKYFATSLHLYHTDFGF